MLFLERCAGCDAPGAALCRTCRFALVGPAVPPSSTAGVITATAFSGRARDVILGLKYRNRRPVARHLAGLIVNRLVARGLGGGSVDVVTWAPTSDHHRRDRGFDQAQLIARNVARQLGVPCKALLHRQGDDTQTGHDRAERLAGPRFRARPALAGRRVLLVDDVVTTGATLERAAEALQAAGASSVVRVAAAATPDRAPLGQVIAGPWAGAGSDVRRDEVDAARARHPARGGVGSGRRSA